MDKRTIESSKIKVRLEYWGGWSSPQANEYKILQIDGAPTVEIQTTKSLVGVKPQDAQPYLVAPCG